MCKLLVFLRSENVTGAAVEMLRTAATHQEQLRFAVPLRHQHEGWTTELRRDYFLWLNRASISLDGGALGPDLTAVGRRFSPFDLLEAIVVPNKTISDQYAATTVVTNDGKVITGRIVNILREQIMIQADMLQPAKLVGIPQREIADMRASSTSLMPSGLLDTLSRDEIMDLLAFLVSGR